MTEEELNKKAKEIEKIYNSPLVKKFESFFIYYLEKLNQSKEKIELARKIDYESIIKIYTKEFEKLWDKYIVPKSIELNNFKESYHNILFGGISHALCFCLFLDMGQNSLGYYKLMIQEFLAPFNIHFQLKSLNEKTDEKIEITKIENLKKLAERGKKFLGKNFIPAEIESFEKIIDIYIKSEKENFKRKYRSIAYHVGKTNLGFDKVSEQEKFMLN